jgi:beta-glucanase (GH16 family)
MLGDSITKVGWPTSGEIDIMEQPLIGDYQNAGSLHYSTTLGGCCDNHTTFTRYFNHTDNLANAFHTYAIAWLPGRVDFYFDGELYGTLSKANAATSYWPFDAPGFLIFDNTTPGNKSQMTWNKSTMLIDYVRVWQLNKLGKVWTH